MKVIPVLDVMEGLAVRAFRGRREEYQPLKSILCPSYEPLEVARAFEDLGFKSLYVADLDAIMRGHPNLSLYGRLASETSLEIMVDSGVGSLERASETLGTGVDKVIVGTETLPDMGLVRILVKAFTPQRVLASIDLKAGRLLSPSDSLRRMDPVKAARVLRALGIIDALVIDLARVGSGEGLDLELLRDIKVGSGLRIYAGGGVRSIEDLEALRKIGLEGVLVASSLHDGRLRAEELRKRGFLEP